jgi:Vanillate O-demethylase oxygenase C-terminal domain
MTVVPELAVPQAARQRGLVNALVELRLAKAKISRLGEMVIARGFRLRRDAVKAHELDAALALALIGGRSRRPYRRSRSAPARAGTRSPASDKAVLEGQQARIGEDPQRGFIDIKADAAGLQGRRLMAQLLEQERVAA